ncbi:MAG: hypothetical protein ACOC4Y_02445 [bacterium]
MAKKEPKTEKGKTRKLWTGDGRKRTPAEDIDKAKKDIGKDMRKTSREISSSLSGLKKKGKGKKGKK